MNLKIVCVSWALVFGSVPEALLAVGEPPARGTWSTQPATRWEAGFLTGNGRMGAIVFGQPANEQIVLNHCRMYRPLGSREMVPDLTGRMDEARQAAKTGGPGGFHNFVRQRCHELGWRSIIWTDPFHPAGVLKLAMKAPPKDVRGYRMSEDFMTGEVAVGWDDSRGTWQRRLFVSRPDNVVVLALQGPRGAVSFDLALEIGHADIQTSIRSEPAPQGAWVTAHAVYAKGKGGYDLAVRVVPKGGKLECVGQKVSVTGADGCLLLAQVVPWKTPLPKSQSEAWACNPENPDFAAARLGRYVPAPGLGETSIVAYANQEQAAELLPKIRAALERLPADYAAILAPHAKVQGELMGRVSFDLGGGEDRRQSTDELLARSVRDRSLPPALMERMYDGCRYLAICSSGEVVPNLQGIWTGSWTPAWSGDWTVDSNLQLAMNSMCSANLAEFMEPYARLLESWVPDMRINARKVYGARGIVANTRASNTCLLLHTYDWVAELCICCGGWMGHYLYDAHRFTGDREFLARRAVPYLKEVALFYEDLLGWTVGPGAQYCFHISYSPEQFSHRNATIDIAVAREVLANLIAASAELGIERESLPRWKEMLAKMPPYLVDSQGALQEWAVPGVRNSYNQRHHSGLYPLYQSFELSREKTPQLWKAAEVHWARKTEEWLRAAKPDSNNITHGMIDHAQCAARLGQGEVMHEVLTRLACRKYLFPSMMMSYWPGQNGFGFDPVGTMPEVVHNALLFSLDGQVELLPALPTDWAKGELRGTRARGQLTIDHLAWDMAAGKVRLELTSGRDQTIALRLPRAAAIASIEASGAEVLASKRGANCREVLLRRGVKATLDIGLPSHRVHSRPSLTATGGQQPPE